MRNAGALSLAEIASPEMREAMEKWERYVQASALTHHFQLPPDYRELIWTLTFRS
jgi:hypothetical protein